MQGGVVLGIYWRKLFFFASLFVVMGLGIYFFSQQFSSAAVNDDAIIGGETGYYNAKINISSNGQVTINDKKAKGLIHSEKDYEEFRYLVLDAPGKYIDFLQIELLYPDNIGSSQIEPIIYAVHGVGSSNYYYQNNNTLVYQAQSISPNASFTIVARFPKNSIEVSFWQKIIAYLSSIPFWIWLVISLVLPITTLVILLYVFLKTSNVWRTRKNKEVISIPPEDITPALAGVLLDGKVSARTIAATLFDLARRGYISIINRGGKYEFGNVKANLDINNPNKTVGLKTFEKILLSKIFTPGVMKSTTDDVQMRIGSHVFSRKVAEVYLAIYEDVTRRGYFLKNPSLVHAHYKSVGLILFFVGIIGLVLGIWLTPDPKYLLLMWAAMIFSAWLIIKIAPEYPPLTNFGMRSRREWVKFRNYLRQDTPIDYKNGMQEKFEIYLPYAVAFGCEAEWSARFFDSPFRPPEWYTSSKPVVIIEDFVTGLFPVISFIGQELAQSREPIVE